jgi:hypothetical protein
MKQLLFFSLIHLRDGNQALRTARGSPGLDPPGIKEHAKTLIEFIKRRLID